MPELPEVETVVRTLERQIKGLTIKDINILYNNIITGDIEEFKKTLTGQTFNNFKRRGKYLLFEMDNITFVSHLRMEGKYYILDPNTPITKHTHVIFKLSNGLDLRYVDVRKFGRMELYPLGNYENFKDLGPEPFSDRLTEEYVYNYLKKINLPIKQILLRQEFIAGIGNIYADEICFACRINPQRKCKNIKKNECQPLIDATRDILCNAIKAGGTTIRSYTSSLGVTGLFQLNLNVHTKERCPICNGEIKKIFINGRGTYFCKECQK